MKKPPQNADEITHLPRRHFITSAAAALTGAAALAGSFPKPAIASGKRQWKMAITYQKALPGLGTGAVRLADRITALSDGALTIKSYGGGELIPPLGVFDAVSQGTVEMGFTAPYYWLSKNRACAFFCTVPGGLAAYEQNAWLFFGGGLRLWHKLYSDFNLIAFPAGNTGVQMGGWFKKEINTPEDIKGINMRIPGLAGEVISKMGGTPQNIPSQDLFTAMQSGRIDALEWVGPWNDLALGFHKVSKYYYGPGFHEAGPTLELMINKKLYEELPKHLQQVIKVACAAENDVMFAEFFANNVRAMGELKSKYKVDVRRYPKPVLDAFFKVSEEVVAGVAKDGDIARQVYESYSAFRKLCIDSGAVMENGYLQGRYEASTT